MVKKPLILAKNWQKSAQKSAFFVLHRVPPMPKNQFFRTPQHPPTGNSVKYGLKGPFSPTGSIQIADVGRILHIFVSKWPKTVEKRRFWAVFGHFWSIFAIFKKIDSPALTPLWILNIHWFLAWLSVNWPIRYASDGSKHHFLLKKNFFFTNLALYGWGFLAFDKKS